MKGLGNLIMQLRKAVNHPYLFMLDEGYDVDDMIWKCSSKFELLDRMLPKLRASGHRILIFSQQVRACGGRGGVQRRRGGRVAELWAG